MSSHGGLAAGLAFLPTWLDDAADATAFDARFAGWVRAAGWRAAGLVWPAESAPVVLACVGPDGAGPPAWTSEELFGTLAALRGGPATVLAGAAGRLLARVAPPGRADGVLWADRGDGPADPADPDAFGLAARLIERSPALAARLGPAGGDPDRLRQRLADAGVVAGRVAHDFDNVLTGIIGFADLAAPLIPAGSRAAKFVAEIATIGHRGVGFTRQLHQFSRGGVATGRPGSVAHALAAEDARHRPAAAPGVEFALSVPADLPEVGMAAAELGVVLGHLLQNAVEATPAGGRVAVAARLVELSPDDARGYAGAAGPGPHVEVAVADTGPGVRPDARARMFSDPFFTTKAKHRGLGLATACRVLAAHRGGVRLDPADGAAGTVARVVVPLAAAPAFSPPPAPAPTAPTTAPTGG